MEEVSLHITVRAATREEALDLRDDLVMRVEELDALKVEPVMWIDGDAYMVAERL